MPQTTDLYHTVIPDIEYFKRQIQCQYACPVRTPAGHYVSAIHEGEFKKAAALARESNPFARICGRICAAPCQKVCRRGSIDAPVQIRMLKRFAMEYEDENSAPRPGPPTGKKVAVVGSGPAGMAAAHYLACRGHGVVIFEALDRPAGMFTVGIPRYRLTEEVIKKDVDSIFSLGIEVRTETKIGYKITIDNLKNSGFQAILLAMGAQVSRKPAVEGSGLKGVLLGINVMRAINTGTPLSLGSNIVVVGGGNVAMDVARSLIRFGKEVHLLCQEAMKGETGNPQDEMPAVQEEIDEALDEGVLFHCSKAVEKIIGNNGRVTGLQTIEVNKLRDNTGRIHPAYRENSRAVLAADTVIFAIELISDTSFLKEAGGFRITPSRTLEVDGETFSAFVPGVYAAGDLVSGPGIAIDAIAQGTAAGRSIHEYLSGEIRAPEHKKVVMSRVPVRDRHDDYTSVPSQKISTLAVESRKKSLQEVEQKFSEETAVKESSRCLRCMVTPVFDGSKCVLCCGCVDVCPSYSLKIVPFSEIFGDDTLSRLILNRYGVSLNDFYSGEYRKKLPDGASAMIKDEERCIRCGICETRCPTGAITMEIFEVEQRED